MKNCEHIREILFSDYHDGSLNARSRKELDGHLSVCPDCLLLSKQIYQQTIEPFNQAQAQMPDEFCWSQIKRRISQQPSTAPAPIPWWMRPVLAAVSLSIMVIVSGVALRQHALNQTPYLAYVMAEDTQVNDEISQSIEEYFL